MSALNRLVIVSDINGVGHTAASQASVKTRSTREVSLRNVDITAWFGEAEGPDCSFMRDEHPEKPLLLNHDATSITSWVAQLLREGTCVTRGGNGEVEEVETPFVWLFVGGSSPPALTTLLEVFRQLGDLSLRDILDDLLDHAEGAYPDKGEVFDPSEEMHLTGDEGVPTCTCCGDRPAEVFDMPSEGHCPTCYKADDRDQT